MGGDRALASWRRKAHVSKALGAHVEAVVHTVHETQFMKELGHSVRLAREPTLAESVAIRDAVADALVGLGAEVTRVGGVALEFHMAAPWKTRKLNPLFAVTGGQLEVSAGAGAQRRIRYSLSFLRLRAYTAVALAATGIVGFPWSRASVLVALALTWLIVFGAPWAIGSRRFRQCMVTAADSVIGIKNG